jgi:hypothetical protein
MTVLTQGSTSVPLVQTLALTGAFSALTHSSSYVLLALGKVSLQAMIFWLLLGILVFLATIVFPSSLSGLTRYML